MARSRKRQDLIDSLIEEYVTLPYEDREELLRDIAGSLRTETLRFYTMKAQGMNAKPLAQSVHDG